MNSGTHFNPVDLVCYLKDYKGEKFNLKEFVDLDTGLISMKSKMVLTSRHLSCQDCGTAR